MIRVIERERLRNPSDAECASFGLASIDLACAVGLVGSETIDVPGCVEWLNKAVAWTYQHTQRTLHQFHESPESFRGSEAIFRMLAMKSVLQRGMGARYNEDRIEGEWLNHNSRDDFLHGVIQGDGGTCASPPVLYAAVGRELEPTAACRQRTTCSTIQSDSSRTGVRQSCDSRSSSLRRGRHKRS